MVSNYRQNGPPCSRNGAANLRHAFANQQRREKCSAGKGQKIKSQTNPAGDFHVSKALDRANATGMLTRNAAASVHGWIRNAKSANLKRSQPEFQPELELESAPIPALAHSEPPQ